MILTLALLATLGSAPLEPVQIAAPLLEGANLSEELTAFYSDHLAQQLAASGLRVTNPRDVSRVLGLERQRQLLGLTDEDDSRLIEIGEALGVDGVVSGSIANLGTAYQVNLRIIHARSAETLTSFSERVRTEEELVDSLSRAARRMAPRVIAALREGTGVSHSPQVAERGSDATPTVTRMRPTAVRQWAIVPAVGGVLLGLVGLGAIQHGNSFAESMRDPSPGYTPAQARLDLAEGQRFQQAGANVALGGVLMLGVAAGMYFLGGEEPVPRIAVVPSREPQLVVQGSF